MAAAATTGPAPKVLAWVPGTKAAATVFGGQQRPHGQAVGQPLGQGHDIRGDAEIFMGKERAGAAQAGLDFIQDQHKAFLIAQLPQAR